MSAIGQPFSLSGLTNKLRLDVCDNVRYCNIDTLAGICGLLGLGYMVVHWVFSLFAERNR